MYRRVVERRLRHALARLSAGDLGHVLAQFREPVRHEFAGEHALGGRRTSIAAVQAWYARLHHLFPDLGFEIEAVHVGGWPWHTVAVVEWRDHFGLPGGRRGDNRGVMLFTVRWGRVHGLSVHCDTDRLRRYLAEILAAGQAEAGALPIVG